ncbi:hypothetical protein ODZ83_05525 [Acaricomes phytoseiuli]|uniref:DUF7341 domain-containing protein n=1 Tax=Acaricomes phytoseiuli TaxID=291968 RepID=UPI002222C636|nr:hypothetical protein [Acaricomes phytoseiuli]MCW1249651.1 hypothetical protein [Acaricomes phytoseiuli]
MHPTLHELTRTHKTTIDRDDGTREYADIPSLLQQLRESANGFGGGGSSGRTTNPAPANLAAIDLYREISEKAQELKITEAPHAEPKGTVEKLIIAWATTAVDQERVGRILDYWAERIRRLLDPPRRFEINTDCPECGARQVINREGIINLAITYTDGIAECAACLTTWAGNQIADLAHQEPNT